MYIITDENKDIIAFHEEYDVCEKYVNNIYRHHGIYLDIEKLKKKKKYLINGLDDLYLVRYGFTYVQEGYLTYLEISEDQLIDDLRYARDVIYRVLGSQETLSNKESNTLSKSAKILENMYEEASTYTPLLSDLKRIKADYDPYFYNMGIF